MARVLVTGSADGLGQMAARLMVAAKHRVVLHARNGERASEALAAVPGAETAVVGDLSSIRETRDVADQVNGLGTFDAIIHNAGIGYRERRRVETVDGLPLVFAVARKWPDVLSNALEPGWVPTKMGGPGAPDDLDEGPKTQVWLATSEEPGAKVSGQYFFHMKRRAAEPAASTASIQDRLLAECGRLSDVAFPP
jgi:NAD(P)-dependent dehydrogenase (short-subunit alcohol dehydrogenase family)